MLQNKVKLIIWDLDETFWSGTLAEGVITPIAANKDIVVTLAERGIVSAIVSKNDHATAEAKLREIGIWDYFVFPRIAFAPKGQEIATLIEEMNLRPDNVLFLDDNVLNLREATHYSPTLMVAEPKDILPGLLDLPELAGKHDRELSRLKQYKSLEEKALSRSRSTLGNEEFLRQCNIRCQIDYDIDHQFDRIVELANRTNQLNFCKLRAETPEAVAELKALCVSYGITTGIVSASDNYGDYGVVGYFILRRLTGTNKLLHFAFSCRTMNMGVEQYIYERLGEPDITVVQPVSNPIKTFEKIDWIVEGSADQNGKSGLISDKKLLLIGGCQLLQLSSYCSTSRDEFVNVVRDRITVRFDDSCFIAGDRKKIKADKNFPKLRSWTWDDVVAFDKSVRSSEFIIAGLFNATSHRYFESPPPNDLLVRLDAYNLKRILQEDGNWFVENYRIARLTATDRIEQAIKCFDRMSSLMPVAGRCFVLGVNTRGMSQITDAILAKFDSAALREDPMAAVTDLLKIKSWQMRMLVFRRAFNARMAEYCRNNQKCIFVDVDRIVALEDIQHDSPDHFNRRGYLSIAKFVAQKMNERDAEGVRVAAKIAEDVRVGKMIDTARAKRLNDDPAGAEALLRDIPAEFRDSVPYLQELGIVQRKLNRPNDALTTLKRLYAMGDRNRATMASLADLLIKAGCWRFAVTVSDEGVAAYPNRPGWRLLLLEACVGAKDTERANTAADYLVKAMTVGPAKDEIWMRERAKSAFRKLGRIDDIKLVQSAAESKPAAETQAAAEPGNLFRSSVKKMRA